MDNRDRLQDGRIQMRFCPACGKQVKQGNRFCPVCGKPLGGKEAVSNMSVRRVKTAQYTPKGKSANIKIAKYIIVLATILVCLIFTGKAFFNSQKQLVGIWVAPGTSNQILEIRTEELKFNSRTFNYTIDGHTLVLEQIYPNSSIIGEMPFKLRGNTLTIDLGTEFSGFFYGRKGEVKLEKLE